MAEPTPDPSHAVTGTFYDQRYAGNYMDTDAYSVWRQGDLNTRQVIETIALAMTRARSVLDYGCGVGGSIGLLSRVFPDAQIAGVDISHTAIEKARQRFPNCRLESFNGAIAPFPDGQFDLVFSYHVLEHVGNIDSSIKDIARMLRRGGSAVIIFPCGNEGSLLDRTMRLVKDGWIHTEEGMRVLFFETSDGHVRRMTSRETISLFARHGLDATSQLFSGHFFGTVDWLCRGTGPAYINRVFSGRPPIGPIAKFRLELTRRILLSTHRLILRKSLDLTKKRNPVKQMAAFLVKQSATLADNALIGLNALEWRLLKHRTHGTAQFLVFRKV